MLDLLMTMGQAASALLLMYGGYLVLMPKASSREEKLPLLRLRTDA
jgi:hypothetical protein